MDLPATLNHRTEIVSYAFPVLSQCSKPGNLKNVMVPAFGRLAKTIASHAIVAVSRHAPTPTQIWHGENMRADDCSLFLLQPFQTFAPGCFSTPRLHLPGLSSLLTATTLIIKQFSLLHSSLLPFLRLCRVTTVLRSYYRQLNKPRRPNSAQRFSLITVASTQLVRHSVCPQDGSLRDQCRGPYWRCCCCSAPPRFGHTSS